MFSVIRPELRIVFIVIEESDKANSFHELCSADSLSKLSKK